LRYRGLARDEQPWQCKPVAPVCAAEEAERIQSAVAAIVLQGVAHNAS